MGLAYKVCTSLVSILTRVYRSMAAVLSNFAHKVVAKLLGLVLNFVAQLSSRFFRIKIVAKSYFHNDKRFLNGTWIRHFIQN